jgi:hypothetical protein
MECRSINTVAEEVASSKEILGYTLERMLADFAYDEILALIRDAKEN